MDKDRSAKRFSVRFDLSREAHQVAWEQLGKIPLGERSEYVIQAILMNSDMHPLNHLSDRIIQLIEEKLQQIDFGSIDQLPAFGDKSVDIGQQNSMLSQSVIEFMESL